MAFDGTITSDQLDFFRTQGYLVIEHAFNAEEVARMQQEADFILELIINSSLANQRRSGRLDWRINPDTGVQIVRKIQPINDLSLYLSQISTDDRLLGPMRQIMEDEPILMEEKLNYKEPLPEPVEGLPIATIADSFPVHNDWAYYQAQGYPQSILSSAIALDTCAADSGPLRVWPGTHTSHLEHDKVHNGLEVKPELVDHAGGQDVLAPAGSVMFFHTLLVHNSRPNTSGRPRRLMIYSHYPEAADMGIDIRNGPGRLRESPYELEYLRHRLAGNAEAPFQAPAF